MKKILFCLLVFVFFSSCKTVGGTSRVNKNMLLPPVQYDAKKDVMILFTGSDWDYDSQRAIELLFTDEFFKKYSQEFKIYNIDITHNRNSADESEIEQAYQYFAEYDIVDCPSVALEMSDGTVYAVESFKQHYNTIEDFDLFLRDLMQGREKIVELSEKVKSTKGPQHTVAVDKFLSEVKLPFSHRYDKLVISAFESDPNNETGLYKKYLLAYTELVSMDLINKDDIMGAAKCYLDIVENPLFTVNEKQGIYYTIAYFLASTDQYLEDVLFYLEKALALNPKSELAVPINRAIVAVKQNLIK